MRREKLWKILSPSEGKAGPPLKPRDSLPRYAQNLHDLAHVKRGAQSELHVDGCNRSLLKSVCLAAKSSAKGHVSDVWSRVSCRSGYREHADIFLGSVELMMNISINRYPNPK